MKESYISQDSRLVFREVGNTYASMIANGCTNTDVVIDNGTMTFNGILSKLNSDVILNGTYSIRIRCKVTNFTNFNFLFDATGTNVDGTGFIFSNQTTGIINSSSGTIYVNGVAGTSISANTYVEIVVTGITLVSGTGVNKVLFGAKYNNSFFLLGDMDSVDIYKGTLTAEEVSALYKNSLYTTPSTEDAVLHIPCQGSIIDLEGNTIVNTDVIVKRDGSKDMMKFNRSTSVLDCGNAASLQLTASILLATWVKTTDTGIQIMIAKDDDTNRNFGLYMDSGAVKFYIFVSGAAKEVISNASTFADGRCHRVIAINNGTDLLIYIDGQLAPSTGGTGNGGVMDNDTVNLTIGDRALLDMPFSGELDDIKMLSTVWTAEQVARDYNSNKSNYNL